MNAASPVLTQLQAHIGPPALIHLAAAGLTGSLHPPTGWGYWVSASPIWGTESRPAGHRPSLPILVKGRVLLSCV